MFNCEQFRELVIVPALSRLQEYSKDAEELLVFTCAVETDGGSFLKQVKGPALGIYSMEPDTHTDIWNNYLSSRANLVNILIVQFGVNPGFALEDRMIHDLFYATVMARLQYLRRAEPLPSFRDIEGIYAYYKKYYNTVEGKSVKGKSIKKYEAFIAKFSHQQKLLKGS